MALKEHWSEVDQVWSPSSLPPSLYSYLGRYLSCVGLSIPAYNSETDRVLSLKCYMQGLCPPWMLMEDADTQV